MERISDQQMVTAGYPQYQPEAGFALDGGLVQPESLQWQMRGVSLIVLIWDSKYARTTGNLEGSSSRPGINFRFPPSIHN